MSCATAGCGREADREGWPHSRSSWKGRQNNLIAEPVSERFIGQIPPLFTVNIYDTNAQRCSPWRGFMELEDDVSKGRPHVPGWRDSEAINGDRLRALLLDVNHEGSVRARGHRRITPAGIVIRGTKARAFTLLPGERRPGDDEDTIDLSYLAGRDGGPLPPLVLRYCIIPAKLRLTGSHFAFLWLEDCLITRIDADNCQIDNHCRLIKLSGVEPQDGGERIAQIRMVGTRVHGTTDLRGCQLRAPTPDETVEASRRHADRYALSLASAEISGRLLLDHQFTALGGVSLYQATIRNSLSLNTARLESRRHDIPALDGEDLRLAGSLIWVNPQSDGGSASNQWHIAGRMVLRRAEIGSDVKLEHCRWAVAGAVSLADAPDQPGGTKVDHISGGIDARACNVAGQLRIGEGCLIGRWRAPPSRRVREDVGSGVYGASLDGWKASIGKGVRIEAGMQPARFTGPVLLNDSKVAHGIIMLGEVDLPFPGVATEKISEAFDLSDARVTGLVRMRCKLSGSLSLRRSRIDGTLELQELDYRRPTLIPGDRVEDCKKGTATILDLSSATISGAVHLGGLCMSGEPRAVWRLMASAERFKIIDRFEGDFADEYLLCPGVAVLAPAGQGRELLMGDAEQLRLLFAEREPEPSPESVRRFVSLHFDNVVDDLGLWTILDKDIPSVEEVADGWLLRNCDFALGRDWHKADLHVARNYKIDRRNERQTARADPVPIRYAFRVGPFRFLSNERHSAPAQDGGAMPLQAGEVLDALRVYAEAHVARPVIVDFRGLTCRAFDDNDAAVWTQLGDPKEWRLLMDGIEFSQFDRTDPKERSRKPDSGPQHVGSVAPTPPASESDRETSASATGSVSPTPPGAEAAGIRKRRRDMLHAFLPGQRVSKRAVEGSVSLWKGLRPLATAREFSPQPFEVFARAYAQSGDLEMAKQIICAKNRLEWIRISVWSSINIKNNITAAACLSILSATLITLTLLWPSMKGRLSFEVLIWGTFILLFGIVCLWPRILLAAAWLFDWRFRFGLKPGRAILTFVACLAVGAMGANLIKEIKPVDRYHPVSVTQKSAEGRARGTADTKWPTDVAVEGCNVVSGSPLDRAIYAFDVFVPLIDVRQECGFTIEPKAHWVRLLKTFYAALGWVIVSLTLLTISGVLRRYIEK